MAIFNRVLSVLIVLLAITAAVFSFLLFQRRQEFRGRADELAKTLSETVQQIDKESQTNVAGNLTFQEATEDRPSSGTLSWQAYHKDRDPETGEYAAFESRVDNAVDAAEAINAQRNLLAETLAETGVNLNMNESNVQPADLKNLDRTELYESTAKGIADYANAVTGRDTRMIQTLTELGNTIGHPIKRGPFQNPLTQEGALQFPVGSQLTALEENVNNLEQRCSEYANTLSSSLFSQIPLYSWQANQQALRNETQYAGALKTLKEDFAGINQKLRLLQVTTQDLKQTEADLADTEQKLSDTKAELLSKEDELEKLQAENRRLKGERGITGEDVPLVDVDKNLEGKVLEVNREWGFIVTDLGRGEINAGMELLVAEGDDFISRVRVTRVLKNVSVAEIQPDLQAGMINVGDRLILPQEEMN